MDRISNYRQARLTLSPFEGDWRRAFWSTHFITVRQGIPRSEVTADGLLMMGTDTPTRRDFYAAMAALLPTLD